MDMKQRPLVKLCIICLSISVMSLLVLGADTITQGHLISGDQTLVSADGAYQLGFFQPENSVYYYLGIWSAQVVERHPIWVADSNKPFTDKYSAKLRILDGNLVLTNGSKAPFWSTNLVHNMSTLVEAVLLNSGNFVLRGASDSNTTPPLWQTFDHLTSVLPRGSKLGFNKTANKNIILATAKSIEDPSPGVYSLELDSDGNQLVLKWNRTKQYWASGPWDPKKQAFTLAPELNMFSHVADQNASYFIHSVFDPKIISGMYLVPSGFLQYSSMLQTKRQLYVSWSLPRNPSQVYAFCGAFGVLRNNFSCECLEGFVPRLDYDWQRHVYSEGCVRKTQMNCAGQSATRRYGFIPTLQMELPEGSNSKGVHSVKKCQSECATDCSCTAYAFDSDTCFIWRGEIMNLQQISSGDALAKHIFIKVAASDMATSGRDSQKKKVVAIVSSITAVVILLSLVIILCHRRKRREKRLLPSYSIRSPHVVPEQLQSEVKTQEVQHKEENSVEDVSYLRIKGDDNGNDVQPFKLEMVLAATENFSDAHKLGSGGFGPVYKGRFSGGTEIAVKRLSRASVQGSNEFRNEVSLIAKLQHRNLVRLLGYCIEEDEKILLYEYMPNKSLASLLFNNSQSEILNWAKRLDIILGIARGLVYLHHDSRFRIVHRDLKPSNILLDGDMNPKISDFGLARIIGIKDTEENTKRVIGTHGYMSPEYALQGFFSVKSDVFSFGVIVLETISRKRITRLIEHDQDLISLPGYAWRLWNQGRALDIMDEALTESCDTTQVLKCITISLLCVQEDPGDRPTMSSVVFMLGSEYPSLPTPKQPVFTARRYLPEISSNSETNSINGLTLTTEQGR